MIELGLGSVQTWECDVMGHLNVQHYVGRASEALGSLAVALGLGPRWSREHGARLVATGQHIRFLREMRPGTPFVISGGVLEAADDTLRLYQEMRNTLTDVVTATFTTEAGLCDAATRARRALPLTAVARAERLAVGLPDHGAPKGLTLYPPRPAPSWAEAEALGLPVTYQGMVAAADCDGEGFMLARGYMGRVADAIPNMIARIRGLDRSAEEKTGGAALEYRLIYRAAPREGDVLALRSGIKAVGGKTAIWTHWLFDRKTGQAVATAEAVTVTFDLATRKAVELGAAARREMEGKVVPGLGV